MPDGHDHETFNCCGLDHGVASDAGVAVGEPESFGGGGIVAANAYCPHSYINVKVISSYELFVSEHRVFLSGGSVYAPWVDCIITVTVTVKSGPCGLGCGELLMDETYGSQKHSAYHS